MANPLGADFDYAAAFEALDLAAVKPDLAAVMTDSQDWWPADFGHYGPFMIRMAWHSAGTYRIQDGRGGAGAGMQRFAPLNSWPDNGNLDKARRLLWPVKQKYGQSISWADLMILAGNVALETMGFTTFGFAGGRPDVWEPDEDVYWGPETEWLGDARYTGDRDLENPLAAVQMGLIYVNPEGPNGEPDPLAAARDIRETFGRMAMNDEETVALIAGGHTFGKTHGAGDPDANVGPSPRAPRIEEQGLGWTNKLRHRQGPRCHHQRHRGHLDPDADPVVQPLLRQPLRLRVGAGREPGRRQPVEAQGRRRRQHGARPGGRHPQPQHPRCSPPTWRCASTRSTSRSRDASTRTLTSSPTPSPGPGSSSPTATWVRSSATSVPRSRRRSCSGRTPSRPSTTTLVGDAEIAALKEQVLASGLTVAQLVSTAWASASTFRGSDKRGGANGARIRLRAAERLGGQRPRPARAWCCSTLEGIQESFNATHAGGVRISLADLIVLAGSVAVEAAATAAGHDVRVPFTPGRTDATQEQTDVESFAALEPSADGFRNFLGKGHRLPAEYLLVDRANLLTLSAPEMTVLVGGLRVLGANTGGSTHGRAHRRPPAR